jgi:hypothetical protein
LSGCPAQTDSLVNSVALLVVFDIKKILSWFFQERTYKM